MRTRSWPWGLSIILLMSCGGRTASIGLDAGSSTANGDNKTDGAVGTAISLDAAVADVRASGPMDSLGRVMDGLFVDVRATSVVDSADRASDGRTNTASQPDAQLNDSRIPVDTVLPPTRDAADSGSPVDLGQILSGLPIYVVSDYASVDSTCAEGIRAWQAKLAETISEERQCEVDDDCFFTSFWSYCGKLCFYGANRYRILEFGLQLTSVAVSGCSTCPDIDSLSLPNCYSPRAAYCLKGQCEIRNWD